MGGDGTRFMTHLQHRTKERPLNPRSLSPRFPQFPPFPPGHGEYGEYGGSGEIPLAAAEEVIYLHEAISA